MASPLEAKGQFSNIPIVFCGIGPRNAESSVRQVLDQGALGILNLGTAGSVKFSIGEIVHCTQFLDRDSRRDQLFHQGKDLGYPNVLCSSGNTIQLEPGPGDVFDMEAYTIAHICEQKKIPFFCYKVITDCLGPDSKSVFLKNVKSAPQVLRAVYNRFINPGFSKIPF